MGVIAGLLVLGVVPDNAFAQTTITFDSPENPGIVNGQIIDTEIVGLSLSSTGGPINAPVIFDSQIVQGNDPDLNGEPLFAWNGGNLAGTALGNLLIVQENDCIDALAGGCDPNNNNFINVESDDRAAGGTITVDFQGTDMCSWKTALIDLEGGENVEFGDFKFFLTGMGEVASIPFELLPNILPVGNNFANTFTTLTAAGPNLGSSFDKVEIIFDGSGAVDNITFQECDVIGGHGKVMDKTSLLVSGAQLTASWMIPLLLSSIGIGVFIFTKK